MVSIQITHRGSYEHYKTRTKVFINWLTEAAHKCCKLDDVVLALKGRAGKQAKQNGEEIPLTTREIILLCQKIPAKQKMPIPDWILALLKSVIDRRTTVAASYSSLLTAEDSDLARANAGHLHFIDVLQQAYDIFAAVDNARITRRSKTATPFNNKTLLDNLFKHLEVEDPSDTQLDEDELEKLAIDTPRVKIRVEADDKQETLVQLMCLLGDTKLVREEIEATFKQYRRGEVTLEVTCLVANIGFGIIRRACEHFTTQRPRVANYSTILDFLGLHMVRHETLVVVTPAHQIEEDDQVSKVPNASFGEPERRRPLVPLDTATASLLCVSGAAIMTEFYDEAQGRHTEDGHPRKRHGLVQLLYDALPGLKKLGNNPEFLTAELGQWYSDEFAAGIVKFLFGGQSGLPIWLAIVAQCYRNIHDILDGHMICGVQTNARRWAEHKKLVKSFDNFAFCTGPEPITKPRPVWSEWFEMLRSQKFMAEVDEHTELGWATDPNRKFRLHSEDSGRVLPDHLITNLPTISGVTMMDPMFLMHLYGCAIANTNFIVHSAAHLYAACRHTGLAGQDLLWPDMEIFLKHHSMYTDNVPGSDPFTMVSHFHLAMGAHGCSLAKVRACPDKFPIKKVRWITAGSKLFEEYSKIQKKNRKSFGSVGSTQTTTIIDAMLEAFANADCPKLNLQGRSSVPTQKVYRPIELLAIMKESLIDDEPVRTFNMIGFTQQCSIFLAEARKHTPVLIPDGESAPGPHVLTHTILTQAAGALDAGLPISHTLLPIVAKALGKTVASAGDKYTKDAYARSSGPQLSPNERPEFPRRPLTDTMLNHFSIFARDCLGKSCNWVVENDTSDGAIFQAHSGPANVNRLMELYDLLQAWDQENQAIGDDWTMQLSFDSEMREWADAGFDDKTMPPILVVIVATGIHGATDDESAEKARNWLRALVLGG